MSTIPHPAQSNTMNCTANPADSLRAAQASIAWHADWQRGRLYQWLRVLFGAYLAVHFGWLAVHAAELFSSAGMLPEGSLSPFLNISPSLLRISDSPLAATLLVASGVPAAIAYAAGRFDRWAAGWMLLILISVFARNPLIANPALPYAGFMLFAHLFTQTPRSPGDNHTDTGAAPMNRGIFLAAWVVLAVSYSYSGYTKLLSPAWVSGDTLALVLDNPLARDWWLREAFLALPAAVLTGTTWFILIVELLFAPLALVRRLRPWLWTGMLVVQFGFLALLRFPDLTIPMLLFHAFTFDPAWLRPRSLAGHKLLTDDTTPQPAGDQQSATQPTLHYDGNCALCHQAVAFALREIPDDRLRFRAVQSDGISQPDTWWLATAAGRLERSDALIALLAAAGGIWRALAIALRLVPAPVDRRYYPAPGKSLKLAARALLLPTRAAISLRFADSLNSTPWASGTLYAYQVNAGELNELWEYVDDALTDKGRRPITEIAQRSAYGDAYFAAWDKRYSLLYTCNNWSARVLKKARLRFSSSTTQFSPALQVQHHMAYFLSPRHRRAAASSRGLKVARPARREQDNQPANPALYNLPGKIQ